MIDKNKLPKNWELKKLGEVARFIDYRGKTPKKTNSGIPLITAKNVKMGFINEEPREFIAEKDYKTWMTRGIPNKGDVLFTTEAPLGNVAQLNSDNRIALAQRLITFQPFDFIDNKFLKYCLLNPNFQELLNSHGTGTTVKGIKAAILKQLEIPLPPLPEQHRIVTKLEQLFSELDKAVESFKKAKELLKTYRQSVLKYAFEGRFTNKKIKKGELPEGWRWMKLGEVAEINRGKSKHRPRDDKELFGGKYPFIQTGEVRAANGGIIKQYSHTYSEVGLKQSKLWPKGTLCLTIAANIAETAFLGFDACFPDSVVGILTDTDVLSIKFINYYVQKLKKEIDNKASATAQKNINIDFLNKLDVPYSPIEEQHLIVQEIEQRLSECDKMEETIIQSLKQSETLRQSILKQAFEGKLVPQDPNDEPAEKLLERIKTEKEKVLNESKRIIKYKRVHK
jgi:type I restriction enzyme, S subunit